MGEMSKVEEVAREMFKELTRQNPELSQGDGFGYAEAGYHSTDERLTILDGAYDLKAVAKAAIKALREPTKEMWLAGTTAIEEKRCWTQDSYAEFEVTNPSDQAVPCFTAMIDEALEENSGE